MWLGFPSHAELWETDLAAAQDEVAALARALAGPGAEQVRLMVCGEAAMAAAKARLSGVENIAFVPGRFGDIWLRDTGPIFTSATDAAAFRFNGWGGKYELEGDDAVADQVGAAENARLTRHDVVLEGGALDHDGEGTVLTTEECLLNHNRNPGLGRERIEAHLRDYLGAEKVVWLGRGVHEDETDGHVDNLACFARPGLVLLTWSEDESDPQHAISADARRRLETATDARGRHFEVVLLPSPGPLTVTAEEAAGVEAAEGTIPRRPGDRLAASYVNFYPANDLLVMPLLDERHDEEAAAVLGRAFPDREVVGVPAREILLGGGNVHCITQQVPTA